MNTLPILSRMLMLSVFYFTVVPVHADGQPVIVTTIRPLGFVAEAIVGDRGHVDVLLSNTVSPHHYALKVSDHQRLLSANIVLWIGGALEGFLVKPMARHDVNAMTIIELPGMKWPPAAGNAEHHEHHHEHGHEHSGRDPHVWLNPLNNIVIVDALLAKLQQIAPQHSAYYQTNAEQLKVALQQLDQRLMQAMQPLQVGTFVVAHPAYNHFVSRYGLHQPTYITLTPERQAGAKHLYHLRQQRSANCVFADYGSTATAATRLAKALEVPLITLDPLGLTINDRGTPGKQLRIVNLIEALAQRFHECLAVPSQQ